MKNRFRLAVAGAAVLAAFLALNTLSARAEHFDIILRVNSGEKQAQSSMDSTPPIGGVNPRPVLKVKAGDQIKVDWRVKNSSPHGTLRNVTTHFFIVRQAKTGQKPVPDPAGNAGIFDTSVTTDLKLGAIATGVVKIRISDPGSYLVRLQSEGTHDEAGHEHFSAIDVEVQ